MLDFFVVTTGHKIGHRTAIIYNDEIKRNGINVLKYQCFREKIKRIKNC